MKEQAFRSREIARDGTSTITSTDRLLGGAARVLRLAFCDDARGVLTPITFAEHEFTAVRAFVVSAPTGAVRGGHAHVRARQILMRVSGIIDVHARLEGAAVTVRLDAETAALLIEPGVWSSQTYVANNSAIVVFSDMEYDPRDYVPGR